MFDFGFWELALVLIISLIVLGPERLPIFASQLGSLLKKIKPKPIKIMGSDILNSAIEKSLINIESANLSEFINIKKEDDDFEKQFSFYSDFDANAQLTGGVLDAALEEILERIIQDIFNASLGNW